MQWINALSTRPSLEAAVAEVTASIKQSLNGTPHLGILFISAAYATDYPRLVPLLLEKLPLPVLIGCSAGGIVGMEGAHRPREIEGEAGLSLTVAHLPEVTIQTFHLTAEDLPDLDSSPQTWSQLLDISPQQQPQFVLLCDPFSSRINDLLEGLDFAYPGSAKVGGLASVGMMGVPTALFFHAPNYAGPSLLRQETIGIALSGKIAVETIVAQGCRPIGQPYCVSQGERNIILELAEAEGGQSNSRPPLFLLQDLMQQLSEKDRELAQNSLFIGVARDEFQIQLRQGDFLIRNLLGVDPRAGAIAIGDRVRPGQRVQFHLRDAETSAEDLQLLLEDYCAAKGSGASGALMFSCLGRGEALYGVPNFDSELFCRYLRGVSLGGFFCNGEIGPVGGSTFLHGYTSAFAIFRQP
jgi:small ligand-binding sensory domain FIST